MFTFHDRVKQRDVYFPWQGQTTWCVLSMAGSHNVIFTLHGMLGPTMWCLLSITGSHKVTDTCSLSTTGSHNMMLIFDVRVKQGVERRPEESVLHSPLPLCWPLGYQSHLLQVRGQVRRHERDGSDVGHPGTLPHGPLVEQEGPRPGGQLQSAHRHWGGGESALLAVCVISDFSL